MHRSELGDLTAFVTIADHLSFRAAATKLRVTPSALSHTMRQLEDRLGVRLLNRTTRSVSLTSSGERLLRRLRPAVDQISTALEDLGSERDHPAGQLRLHSHPLGAPIVAQLWGRFLSTYPDVELEVQVDSLPVDIVSKGFDAGIPWGPSRLRSSALHNILPADAPRARWMIWPRTIASNIAWESMLPSLGGPLKGTAESRRLRLRGR